MNSFIYSDTPDWANKWPETYEKIVLMLKEQILAKGDYVYSIDNNKGILVLGSTKWGDFQVKISLESLYKQCLNVYIDKWGKEIEKYLKTLDIGATIEIDLDRNRDNYDKFRPYLRTRLVNINARISEKLEYRKWFGEMSELVQLQLPINSYWLDKETIKKWAISIDTIFTDARNNNARTLLDRPLYRDTDIVAGYRKYCYYKKEDDERRFSTLSTDFEYLDSIQGKYGVIIEIPNEYEISIYALNELKHPQEFIEDEAWFTLNQYNEAQLPLCSKLIWYYDKEYTLINYEIRNGEFIVNIPYKMKNLLQFY